MHSGVLTGVIAGYSQKFTACLVQSNTTFVVLFIIYYSTGDRFRSIGPPSGQL